MIGRSASFLIAVATFFLLSFSPMPSHAQEGSITYGQTVTGSISTRNPVEIWTFEGRAGDVVEITMTSVDGLEPYLQLVDPSDAIIGSSVSGEEPAHIAADLALSGIFTVIASRNGDIGGDSSGTYQLRIERSQVQTPPTELSDRLTDNIQVQQSISQARTHYEGLDLATPVSAVQTLAQAFRNRDFLTVYMVLAPDAQFRLYQEYILLRYGCWVNIQRWEAVMSEMELFSPRGFTRTEHHPDMPFVFDDMMQAALLHEAFLVDLRGSVEVTDVFETALRSPRDSPVVEVRAHVEHIDELAIFRVVQAPSGRWRVFQVVVPGGDEGIWPWASPLAVC